MAPNNEFTDEEFNEARRRSGRNTVGHLMERIAARKLARDLEDRGILPANQVRGSRPGTCTWKNATAFTDDVYEGSQRNQQTMAVAIDLEDACNRVQFKLRVDMLMQYGVCLTLTRWIAGAPLERKVVIQLGNWISVPHQLTMGLPQGSPLSEILFNVYAKGLADLKQNGPSKILTEADDGFIYKTSRDSQEAADAMQQQLDADPSGVTTLDHSSIQTRHKHCGALLITEQSNLMELWSKEQVI